MDGLLIFIPDGDRELIRRSGETWRVTASVEYGVSTAGDPAEVTPAEISPVREGLARQYSRSAHVLLWSRRVFAVEGGQHFTGPWRVADGPPAAPLAAVPEQDDAPALDRELASSVLGLHLMMDRELLRRAQDPAEPLGEAGVLRLHLMSEHATWPRETGLASMVDLHEHEHAGPGTIRDHDPGSTAWSPDKAERLLREVEEG